MYYIKRCPYFSVCPCTGFHCSAYSGRGLVDLPYPGYISDADRGNTNVLCC